MDLPEADDATDFRPFFDMVIGILFVLLILVAAQIYFQQAAGQAATSEALKEEARLRRGQIASFLDALARRLQADGLRAVADVEGGAVLLPLGDVLALDGAGLPSLKAAALAHLGQDLSAMTGCVTVPRDAGPDCAAYDRLHLDTLATTLRLAGLPPTAALPRDRFGALAGAVLSASLLQGAPALIGASNDAGGRVVTAGDALAGSAEGPADQLGGDLVLDFTFR